MKNETVKREKFVRLAEGRTTVALDAIRKIGNLSNTNSYEYSKEDVAKIVKALKNAIAEVEVKFDPKTEPKESFKL